MNFLKILFITLILVSTKLSASEIKCSLSYDLMELIASIERHHKRPVGYPYLISFNTPVEYKGILEDFNYVAIDSRTLDCKNKKSCIKILNYLESSNIKNLDLGAFQLNYIHHKFNKSDYFVLESSYQRACSFLERLIDRHGYSWQTVARYHSSTPSVNVKYQKAIARQLLAKK